MVLDTEYRNSLQQYLFDPFSHFLIRIFPTINPNHLTILAVIIGVLIYPLLVFYPNTLKIRICACVLLAISGFLDAVDGTVARIRNCHSDSGAVLDIVGDRIVESMVIFAIRSIDPVNRDFMALCMITSVLYCITSFLIVSQFNSLRGPATKVSNGEKSFQYSPGLVERSEAFLFFGFMILLPQYCIALGWTFSLLVTYTAIARVYQFFVLTSFYEKKLQSKSD